MEESSQQLAIQSGPHHVNWVTSEAATEGVTSLLATLWLDTHPLVDDLLYLVCRNSRERQAILD